MGPRFVVLEGSMTGRIFELDRDRYSIGRGPMNDIDVFDVKVSQRHCLLESRDGQLALVDLGSRNGTFVNDIRISGATVLKDADEVRIGSTKLIFCTEEVVMQPAAESAGLIQTVELIPSESQYLRTTLSIDAASKPRIARDLNALLRLSTRVRSTGPANSTVVPTEANDRSAHCLVS